MCLKWQTFAELFPLHTAPNLHTTNAAPEDPQAKANPTLFKRSLPNLGKTLPDSWKLLLIFRTSLPMCGKATPQTRWKSFMNVGINFKGTHCTYASLHNKTTNCKPNNHRMEHVLAYVSQCWPPPWLNMDKQSTPHQPSVAAPKMQKPTSSELVPAHLVHTDATLPGERKMLWQWHSSYSMCGIPATYVLSNCFLPSPSAYLDCPLHDSWRYHLHKQKVDHHLQLTPPIIFSFQFPGCLLHTLLTQTSTQDTHYTDSLWLNAFNGCHMLQLMLHKITLKNDHTISATGS